MPCLCSLKGEGYEASAMVSVLQVFDEHELLSDYYRERLQNLSRDDLDGPATVQPCMTLTTMC